MAYVDMVSPNLHVYPSFLSLPSHGALCIDIIFHACRILRTSREHLSACVHTNFACMIFEPCLITCNTATRQWGFKCLILLTIHMSTTTLGIDTVNTCPSPPLLYTCTCKYLYAVHLALVISLCLVYHIVTRLHRKEIGGEPESCLRTNPRRYVHAHRKLQQVCSVHLYVHYTYAC